MSDETPLTPEELKNIRRATQAGHGNGGGDARWNARWLATLDVEQGRADEAWNAGYDEGFAASKRLCDALERAALEGR